MLPWFFLPLVSHLLTKTKIEKKIELFKEFIPFFKASGIETGIWLWTFWRSDLTEQYIENNMMVTSKGKKKLTKSHINSNIENHSGYCCPSSPEFVNDALKIIKSLAELKPDIMMFDDDFRFGALEDFSGCYCDRHLEMTSKKLGRNISREELFKAVYEGKPNAERKAWLDSLGESLENFAKEVRKTVDSVDPNIRFALCAVSTSWGNDGSDCITLAKLLAGNTRPLMRFIGPPYWSNYRVNTINDVIELERMQDAWCVNTGIETMTEGDAYPRPRYQVPASYLECFDSALRVAGVADGILKYMLDYTSSTKYETGYEKHQNYNSDMYNAIDRIFANKKEVGVKVYEIPDKFRRADFTNTYSPERYVDECFKSGSALLSDCGIPTVHKEDSNIGIAFAEGVYGIDFNNLKKGLILDIRAARILMENGIDVGLEKIGGNIKNDLIFYPEENEYVKSYYEDSSAFELFLKPGAKPVAYSTNGDEKYVDTYLYENANGTRFLVFGFDAANTSYDHHRNYSIKHLISDKYEWLSGEKIPVRLDDDPYAYTICKKDENGNMAVGIWNIFADEIKNSTIILDNQYSSAEIIGAKGELSGNKIKIESLGAYKFCFINLKK